MKHLSGSTEKAVAVLEKITQDNNAHCIRHLTGAKVFGKYGHKTKTAELLLEFACDTKMQPTNDGHTSPPISRDAAWALSKLREKNKAVVAGLLDLPRDENLNNGIPPSAANALRIFALENPKATP